MHNPLHSVRNWRILAAIVTNTVDTPESATS
jgi:hypothetical protein